MLRFLKSVLKSTLVTIISFFVILLILVVIGISTSSSDKKEVLEKDSVLKITLDQEIVDRSSEFDFNFNSVFDDENTLGLNTILKSIDKAKIDDRIKGIYLNIENVSASTATLEEIRDKLQEFKDSTDKFIIAYGEIYTQKSFYLSSVAHQLYLHPQGALEFKGLSYEGMFFKGALEKLDVEPQIIRHGKFKSAVEPFILDKMSPANKEQVTKLIYSIWKTIKSDVAFGRNLTENTLNNIAQNLNVQSPQDAVDFKLADALIYEDQLMDTLKKKLNLDSKNELNSITINSYQKVGLKSGKKTFSKDKIAVIYAQGSISSGEGDNESIGSVTTSEAIKQARTDDKIKAIVLRVNSPGGSALASETILREMELAKSSKPVVVSMGDVAASGGYYISCKADTIVANPTTITGSIGVLGILFNIENMLKNKMGITVDKVKTNPYADLGTPTRALSNQERNMIQQAIERIYDRFITVVSEGRNMTKAQVDSIGQGRIWTGEDALKLGLVDILGGLEDAIEIAAQMADLKDYRITNLPKIKNPIEKIMEDLGGKVQQKMIKNELGSSYPLYLEMKEFQNMEPLQMRMPTTFNIY
jgi:protease-4